MATDFRLKDQLPDITERLVETYEQLGTINHLDHCPLPSYEEVTAAIDELTEVLYPGYRRREGLHHGNIQYYVGEVVDRLHDRLTRQIGRALRHEAGATSDCDGDVDFEALGQAKTLQFLNQLPELRSLLATDVQAAYDGDPACKSPDEVIFCYPGLEAITVYRLAHLLYQLEIPFIPRMMSEWAHNRTGIDIHPGATIGAYFFIDHGTGVVVGEDVRDWRARETVSGRHARRPQLPDRRRRKARPRTETASDDRRPRGRVRERHYPRRAHRHRARLGDRLERLAHSQRRSSHDRAT